MRFILPILMFNGIVAFAQNSGKDSCSSLLDTLTNQKVFKFIDRMPAVQGGMQALIKEIQRKIRYPHNGQYPVESRVIIAFVIEVDGSITGKRIIQNVAGTDLGNQLLDIVDDFKWEPGTCNGKKVPTLQLFPMIVDVDK
jgi:outer membrane biosynthesis protein TonB